MSEVELLSYPGFIKVNDEVKQLLNGRLCYHYGYYNNPGYSILIYNNGGDASIKFGDWGGNSIVPDEEKFNQHQVLLGIMKYAGIERALYFFDNKNILCDVQLALNRWVGPGMIRDLFSNKVDIMEPIAIEPFDENKSGIVKPSKFSFYKNRPLFVEL